MSAGSGSADKTERLLNLVLALKSARRPLSKQRLREALPAYAAITSDEAFDRMFERDKDELREMGIPVTATVIDVLFDDEIGYRIDRDEAALPGITFEADERTALALAAQAWSTASMSGTASAALRKLRLAGVEIDTTAAAGLEPRIRTTDPSFDAVRAAVTARQPITFEYRRADGETSTRKVQPWALTLWRAKWYLTGHDLGREGERNFRLNRIVGPVRKVGRAGGYEVPADHDPTRALRRTDTEPQGTALVRVRRGRGAALHRRATTTREVPGGWVELEIPYDPSGTVADVAALGSTAVAVSPPELVTGVRHALEAALLAHGGSVPTPKETA